VYDASGNTFVIFNTNDKKDYSQEAIEYCKKENVDGLIVVVAHKNLDFEWLFYNNDGSTASMCGNGTRAVAHFAFTKGIAPSSMKFLTGAGVIACTVEEDIVETQMTEPKVIKESFEQEGLTWWLVDTGVPHLVTIVDDIKAFDKELCSKMRYEHNANVNFVSLKDKNQIFVRTYERGVEDETQACGTGMVASFLRMYKLGKISNIANVYPTSLEELTISFKNETLYFKGKVVHTKDV
jgi:diaminopimelate epimerase